MANLKSFEQFVAEQDRAEEIEKDIVDQGTPKEHDAEEADAVQSQGQETNEAVDVAGIQADELKDDSKDVTPPVVDADGKEYAKAEDRAEDDSKELEADLAKTADGEVIAKVVVEGEEVNETAMSDALNQIHQVLSSAPAIETQVAIGKALMALAVSGAVSPIVLKAIELFKKESPKAAAKIEANESVTENLDKASIKRMEGVVSQANLKKMLDGISGVISDLTDDGFEYEEAVDYVAFKIDDKLAGKF